MTAPRRRAVENRWIGHRGGIDSTGGAREHRHCHLNRARLCRPPESASVAVATHASADRARFQQPLLPNMRLSHSTTPLPAHRPLRSYIPIIIISFTRRHRCNVGSAQTHTEKRLLATPPHGGVGCIEWRPNRKRFSLLFRLFSSASIPVGGVLHRSAKSDSRSRARWVRQLVVRARSSFLSAHALHYIHDNRQPARARESSIRTADAPRLHVYIQLCLHVRVL